jgi:hypothetical protein
MIPTRGKTKIPQGWSYPVGAEIVSKALEAIPQYESVYLRFLWLNPSSHLARKDKSRLHILGVRYIHPQHTANAENWHVDISAVPSEIRVTIRSHLIDHVLPYARLWMTTERLPSWYGSWKNLDVDFNLETEQFEYQESEVA